MKKLVVSVMVMFALLATSNVMAQDVKKEDNKAKTESTTQKSCCEKNKKACDKDKKEGCTKSDDSKCCKDSKKSEKKSSEKK